MSQLKSQIVTKLRSSKVRCTIADASVLVEKCNKYGIGINEIIRAINVVGMTVGPDEESPFGGKGPSALDILDVLKQVYEPKPVSPYIAGSGSVFEGLTPFESNAINAEVSDEDKPAAVEAMLFFSEACKHQSADSKVGVFLKMMNYGISVEEMREQINPREREFAGSLFNKAVEAKNTAKKDRIIFIPNYDQRKIYVIFPDKPSPAKAREMFGYDKGDFDAPVGSVPILRMKQYDLRREDEIDESTAKATIHGWEN